MSEDRSRQSFFSRMFAPVDDEGTTTYSRDDIGEEHFEQPEGESVDEPRGFTVERAADIIRELPPEVPRRSAVRIVRQTLIAAGISVDDLGRSTRVRESKLNSEIELRQQRIEELQQNTDEVIRDLEDQIKKAREARDFGVAEEERGISEAREGLEDVEKVRDFFDLPRGETRSTPFGDQSGEATTGENATYPVGDETQVMDRSEMDQPEDPANMDDTQILRPRGPLSEEWEARRDTENRQP
ncbi:MAG TPA: hypothetical protein VFJ72_11275 [Rubrobacteraceae bacterium]|nr:hypothetical protein [Rubrobacteraceae bacterium]